MRLDLTTLNSNTAMFACVYVKFWFQPSGRLFIDYQVCQSVTCVKVSCVSKCHVCQSVLCVKKCHVCQSVTCVKVSLLVPLTSNLHPPTQTPSGRLIMDSQLLVYLECLLYGVGVSEGQCVEEWCFATCLLLCAKPNVCVCVYVFALTLVFALTRVHTLIFAHTSKGLL